MTTRGQPAEEPEAEPAEDAPVEEPVADRKGKAKQVRVDANGYAGGKLVGKALAGALVTIWATDE